MSLSEYEAEERLAALRRQREALDREIADLILYIELGRRLNAGAGPAARPPEAAGHPRPVVEFAGSQNPGEPLAPEPRRSWDPPPAAPSPAPLPAPLPAAAPARTRRPPAPEPVAFAEDPTGARRYGRALVEAACAAIAEAGRPLHAREIHDVLIARGFAIPGRDPVAALNTRLWKRSGESGPLRRHGEAVYGLADS